jgi:hypothetical protein
MEKSWTEEESLMVELLKSMGIFEFEDSVPSALLEYSRGDSMIIT